MKNILLLFILLLSGCAHIPFIHSNPRPKKPVEVWRGPADTYHAVGTLGTKHGLFLTTSNVGRGAHRSKIFIMDKNQNVNHIYTGNQETIGQPFEHDNKVYFPVEHGTHVLVYDNGRIRNGARTNGRWSIAGGVFANQPFMAYNNRYAGNFQDRPVIANAETGQILKTYDAITFPRSFTIWDRQLCMTGDYGEDVLFVGDFKRPSRMLHITSYNKKIYGGGGMNWGPASIPDGRIFVGDKNSEKTIYTTRCKAIEHVTVLNDFCFFAGTYPHSVYALGRSGKVIKICEFLGEPEPTSGGAFGAAVAYYNDNYWFFRTAGDKSILYRLDKK